MLLNKGNWSAITTSLFVLLGFQLILHILQADLVVQACGPGRAGGRRFANRLRKYPPLVQRQYIPNVSENTFGASGAPEGPIKRHDKRFKELIQNWNPDIEFRDDERTGADRMMSQRLKEKLSVLAISVMNQWPNVRLRVIEGWDEDRRHSANSLHYEGRAVDITTSDKDRSKYGMLARLAVEAGFDWVHYESRSHVHCSVKSEKADSIRNNGCFDAESVVETPMGQMEMSQLQTNDLVLTMNSQTGELQFSPVLMWLDRDELNSELYVNLTTKSGKQIRLTSSHLIYLADEPMPSAAAATASVGPTADSVNGDLSSKANNNRVLEPSDGGNNYYYDLVLTQGKQTNANESVVSIDQDASQIQIAPASIQTNSPGVQVEPSSPNQREEVGELNDYVYTTYARNAVVGQYLLIHKPDDEVKFDSSMVSHDGSVLAERRFSPNRLMFTSEQDNELNSRKTSKDAEFKIKKNKKYKHNQPQPVTRTKVVFDEIVSVKYVSKHGIYAPLTRDGNIVVNSVVASCYAVISDHDMAHWSMAPVRWLNSLNEKLFGLRPETPTYERTVDFIRRRKLYEQRQQIDDASDQHDNMKNIPDYNTTNSLNRTTATRGSRHVHWYPIVLYNIARYVLPNNYLY